MPVFVLENPSPAPSNLLLGFRAKPYSLDGFKLETTQVKTRSAAEQHGFQNAITLPFLSSSDDSSSLCSCFQVDCLLRVG